MLESALWEALGGVPDRRGRQGRPYSLRSILGNSLAAMLAGANDLRAIFRWGRRLRPEARRAFWVVFGNAPAMRPITIFSPHSMQMRCPGRWDAMRLGSAGGHYLFTVKSNQPTLRRDIEAAFGDDSPSGEPPSDLREAPTIEKGHGRIETRRIPLSTEAVAYLDWPGLAQIARLERRRESRGRESVETAWLITSLPPDKAGPERLLALARAHWAIENRLHHVRDVSFNEDRCRSRAGARPLATLRNLAIALIRRSHVPIPEARENFREHRASAIQAVTNRFL